MRAFLFSILFGFALFLRAEVVPQKSPADSLAAMRPRPGFAVELVAAAPMVESPVAFEWDARGRLWVVELRDYPQGIEGKGAPGGRVKVLTDSDGDGRFDNSVDFADALPFATGIAPWRDGVIVAAAPDILFLRDTDGDGKSDSRTVLFTGFKEGNIQHWLNGFEWGLDGWFYGANGDSGGTVSDRAINGHDFRFRPDGEAFETEIGASQYGRRRDDWGNWFGSADGMWVWHYFLEERYFRKNPKTPIPSAKHMLPVNEEPNRVFPAQGILDRIVVSKRASAPTPYRDALFGPEFFLSVFICDAEHGVVHREVMVQDGATFFSRRALDEEKSEFLTSSDPSFDPRYAKTGPDGSLYISDSSRIWRQFPSDAKPRAVPNLEALANEKLVVSMESGSGWQRDTVQRLLVEREAQHTLPSLRRLLRHSKIPQARLQALATLGCLKGATPDDIRAGLRDRHPSVVIWALRLAETSPDKAELLDALVDVLAIPDIQIRRQLAFSLGSIRDPRAGGLLEKLAEFVATTPELRLAILASIGSEHPLFEKLNVAAPTVTRP